MTETTVHRERSMFDSASYLATLMAELDRAAISARIRQARNQAGLRNRQELAELLQVHWRTIEDWESPKHANVPCDRLDEIARATGVSREWLLHGEPEAEADELASIALRLQSLEALVAESMSLTRRALELLDAQQVVAAPPVRKRASG